ncbi:molecular chaperone DnaJ [Prosthecomicrobium hirschii]|uniref:molecular chaperone DnaJ n=1 Tax=Prosthecodimorpha hirschii TaxID=665126 RepID=UPI00112B8569|nr:molecular chaperone DnaJ [Prosthecomicrobium hirschii]MCW1841646.1 molecular chaperone DnaJ [Prosthecomicrobium hirschii]TPQ51669.1 molecular chaperone DnaJ [Prosthecomicrobium hirschii]
MSKRDYYEVLGVSKTADEKDLKSAFRKLAMQFHPDRNPGNAEAEAKFKEINEAYDVLKDGQKRAAYDRFGHAAFENGGGGGPGGPGFNGDFAQTMSDIFESFFGGEFGGAERRGRGGRERGADLRYNMEITLEEAYEGKQVEISVPTSIVCETCSGTGAKPGTSPQTCKTCGGQGRVRAAQGFFTIERTCPTCQGRGQVIAEACAKCGGTGRTTTEKTLTVSIPAGIEDGTRIRLSGEGEAGARGGPAGDLYIFIGIKPHAFFQRDGADIFCRVPVSMTTAALGGQFDVPTLSGEKTKVKVPDGTQTGKQFRLRGKGMPVMRSAQQGDMYIQVIVETPRNLNRRQRELLEEFERASSGDTHPESAGFFAKVKDFFDNLGG